MKECDIRPADILNEYLRLSAEDSQKYFNSGKRTDISCPACESREREKTFTKHGFEYWVCKSCSTLYQSPRPPLSEYETFYEEAPSSRYWAQTFFPSVAEARREKIFKPRVARIKDWLKQAGVSPKTVMDVGAGYGLFLEEWQRAFPESNLLAVEPSPDLAGTLKKKGFEVLETIAEKADAWRGKADFVTCFEVIEHAYSPLEFIKSLFQLLKPGGHLLVTGLGVDGFDIQLLWEKSKSVSPPHHVNFMSITGFKRLFERAGFEQVSILTPGELDVDIVRNALKEDPGILNGHRFERILLSKDEKALQAFQNFLSANQLSSHTWIFARKP